MYRGWGTVGGCPAAGYAALFGEKQAAVHCDGLLRILSLQTGGDVLCPELQNDQLQAGAGVGGETVSLPIECNLTVKCFRYT